MMCKGLVLLLAIAVIHSAQGTLDDVIGTWRGIPSLTTGLTKEFILETGNEPPADLDLARNLVVIINFWKDDKGFYFRQNIENGPRVGADTDGPIPLEKPTLYKVGDNSIYATMEEIERGVIFYAHIKDTPLYFEEAFQVNEKDQLVRTMATWKSGHESVSVCERMPQQRDEF